MPALTAYVVSANPFVIARVDNWVQDGWSGADAEEVQIVDRVAKSMRADGTDRAAIGYQNTMSAPSTAARATRSVLRSP